METARGRRPPRAERWWWAEEARRGRGEAEAEEEQERGRREWRREAELLPAPCSDVRSAWIGAGSAEIRTFILAWHMASPIPLFFSLSHPSTCSVAPHLVAVPECHGDGT